jgi:hypothetical protein
MQAGEVCADPGGREAGFLTYYPADTASATG